MFVPQDKRMAKRYSLFLAASMVYLCFIPFFFISSHLYSDTFWETNAGALGVLLCKLMPLQFVFISLCYTLLPSQLQKLDLCF